MPPSNNTRTIRRFAHCSLYSNKSKRAYWRKVPIRAGQKILGLLPNLTIDPLFAHSNPDYPLPCVRHAIVLSSEHRFLVVGYRHPDLPPNPIITAIGRDLVWRGEVAVFHIGWAVPYLASPATKKLRDNAVVLFVSRTMEAFATGRTPPAFIHA